MPWCHPWQADSTALPTIAGTAVRATSGANCLEETMSNLVLPSMGLGRRAAIGTALAAATLPIRARAQNSGPIRVGVLGDESSYSADASGPGAFLAARMAAADVGPTVLGLPIQIIHADSQLKPDVAGAIAREWYDGGVDAIVDLPATPVAASVQRVAADKKKTVMITAAAAEEFTSKWCAPTSVMWADDTHALATGAATPTVRAGGKSWFFITVDFAFGTSLEREVGAIVAADGGQVLGSVRYPQNNADFSSMLLQAQASGAQAIGLCSVAGDLVNVIKQAGEFGLQQSGKQSLVAFLVYVTDIHALGLKTAQGLTFSSSFYWDQNDEARSFAKRFMAEHKAAPTREQAQVYAATRHFLTSMAASGSRDPLVVNKAMRDRAPFYFGRSAKIREDGRVLFDITRWKVKAPQDSTSEWDLYQNAGTVTAEEAFLPMNAACKFPA
jgi:branched-chain amino acid transport system substrate-binding protein